MDKIEELKKLKGLLDNGFITQEEFITLKNEILGKETPVKKVIEEKEEAPKPEVPSPEKVIKETKASQEPVSSKVLEKEEVNPKKDIQKESDEIKKEQSLHEIKRKCKKCDKEISKYLDESNKGLCVECNENSFQIPKWAYLFLLLLLPLAWWIFKDSSFEQNPNNVIKDKGEVNSQNENASLNFTNTSNHFVSNQDLIALFNVTLNDLGDNFMDASNSNSPEFEITSKQFFNIGGRELLLTSLGIKNPNECHVCLGRLDIGFFEFSNGKWMKINHLENASSAAYGSYPTFNEFKLFGKNKLCAEFTTANMGMGYEYAASLLFGLNNNVISKIATIITSENSRTSNEERNYEFIDTGKEYYTIKITEKVNGENEEIKYLNFNSNINEFKMNESTKKSDKEINNKDYYELGNYIVKGDENERAYFHNKPQQSTQRKAYLVKGENVYVQKIENGFGYVEFTNTKGIESFGWIKLATLRQKK